MIHGIGPRDAEALMANGGLDIVDVREPREWATGHVPGARLVPLGTLRADVGAAGLSGKVLFVCASGGRSMTAAKLAEAHGLTDVYSLDGGTSGWAAERLPIVVPPVAEPSRPQAVPDTSPSEPAQADEADAELDAVVGANVKELRTRRGLTLDLLAGLSGVGRQTLGQIENGRTVPSVATLWKIAKAFDVPFSALLARPHTRTTTVLRQSRAKRLVSADGRFSSRALFPAGDRGGVELYELWLAGHGREDAEAHAPGTRENLVVTAGRLVLDIGEETFELAKGDAIEFIADVPHSYVNPGSEDCWMNLVMTYEGRAPGVT
jgi:rhodanese-related sulfurtransferase/transcriptional regulator with XRE-family HTH domain